MQSGHSWKYRFKKNLVTTWIRGVVHWTCCVSLQMSPFMCKIKKSWNNWWYSRTLPVSHTNSIHLFRWSHLSGCFILKRVITTSILWGTIFTNRENTVGIPKTNGKPVSIPPEQTWCTSKGRNYITSTNCKRSITTKGGHSLTTKGGAKNQCTIYKGEYTKTPAPTIP